MTLAMGLSHSTQARQAVPPTHADPVGLWTTLAHDTGHSGYNSGESAINATTAPSLALAWSHQAAGPVTSQPVVWGNTVYWGSWDGFEHASDVRTGSSTWETFVGTTVDPCGATVGLFGPMASGTLLGVTATAALVSIGLARLLIVSGGDRQLYALDPASGAIVWHTLLNFDGAAFLWSSPAAFNGNIYIGVASIGDCPLVAGQIVELSGATGAILHTFTTVPAGCIGAGVWSTPTIDAAAGTLYFTTGNAADSCVANAPYAESIVELHASDLSFVHSWQVPVPQRTGDGDFGATPTLFTATINGASRQLVGAANKNGIFYAWDRADISAGPLWQRRIAVAGSCPECGQGSIAPAAWDGSRLYVAGGNTTIGGHSCKGSVRALNPASGNIIWEHCMQSGPVLGAVTAVPGVVAAAEANWLIVMAASNGPTLFRFAVADGNSFFSGAAIANGQLYIGNNDGILFAFKL
jgi:polyvinyl alcohol dehydrogenase (cytochrome)